MNNEDNVNNRLMSAVSDRMAHAIANKESSKLVHRWLVAIATIGLMILFLLVYLVLHQETHNIVTRKDAEESCLNIYRESAKYPPDVLPEMLSHENHKDYHQCVKCSIGKDSKYLIMN